VNLVMLETFTDLDELLLALYVKQSLHHCPAVCSLACKEDGRLDSGMTVAEAFAKLRGHDAEITGINCVNGPQAMLNLFEKIPAEGLLSAYPNAGLPGLQEGRSVYDCAPDDFAKTAVALAGRGARLIGGCCGTGPRHIAAMAEALKRVELAHFAGNR
jgi:homocysteine S-methyltransferase